MVVSLAVIAFVAQKSRGKHIDTVEDGSKGGLT